MTLRNLLLTAKQRNRVLYKSLQNYEVIRTLLHFLSKTVERSYY